MRAIVEIGKYSCSLSTAEIRKSIYSLVDTCELYLPVNCHLIDMTDGTIVQCRNNVLNSGDKVVVRLGYDDDIHTTFEGFVVAIEKSIPLKIYCEGYSFLLRDKVINKSFENVTMLRLLSEIIGYEERIQGYAVDVNLQNVFLHNVTSYKALQWIKDQLQCDVFFKGSTLYCLPSLKYLEENKPVKLRLGWNTIENDKLQADERAKILKVVIVEHTKKGNIQKSRYTDNKYDTLIEVRIRQGMPEWFIEDLREKIQQRMDYRGFKGEITTFLVPFIDKGDIVEIEDKRYPQRSGKYYVYGVKTTFGVNGGRQILNLGALPKNN